MYRNQGAKYGLDELSHEIMMLKSEMIDASTLIKLLCFLFVGAARCYAVLCHILHH